MIPEAGTPSELKSALYACNPLPDVGDVYEVPMDNGLFEMQHQRWTITKVEGGTLCRVSIDVDPMPPQTRGVPVSCYMTFEQWWNVMDDGKVIKRDP